MLWHKQHKPSKNFQERYCPSSLLHSWPCIKLYILNKTWQECQWTTNLNCALEVNESVDDYKKRGWTISVVVLKPRTDTQLGRGQFIACRWTLQIASGSESHFRIREKKAIHQKEELHSMCKHIISLCAALHVSARSHTAFDASSSTPLARALYTKTVDGISPQSHRKVLGVGLMDMAGVCIQLVTLSMSLHLTSIVDLPE